ncbi:MULTISPECIES: CAP domain-containing protein [unclassified Sphingomonas]|uniref:CAP domain-containing protein n=1 Tax=unclassified Sphingomonas TaxID=196159 RepID=UPI0035A85BE2
MAMVIGWMAFAMLALAPADYYIDPQLEADVLAELNRARADPQGYADDLREYRNGFDGLVAYSRETPDGIMTKEGAAAVEEAIAFLDRQSPLPPLGETGLLSKGAGDLVADQGPTGRVGHISAGGLNPSARMLRHGGGAYVAEVITYGPPDPRSVVRQLIVDDGVARRGHRLLVFSGLYRFAGVACGPHATYGAMCVVDMSASADGRPVVPRDSSAALATLIEDDSDREGQLQSP